MLSYWDNSVYCSPLAEVLSLDSPPPRDDRCGPTHWGDVVDPAQDVSGRISDSAIACVVRNFLATLSPRDQDVVRRVFWDGECQAEVARTLGLSRMAVTKIIQKVARLGRKRLPEFQNFSLN